MLMRLAVASREAPGRQERRVTARVALGAPGGRGAGTAVVVLHQIAERFDANGLRQGQSKLGRRRKGSGRRIKESQGESSQADCWRRNLRPPALQE